MSKGWALTDPVTLGLVKSYAREHEVPMRRREFMTLLGGVASWPGTAHAESGKLPVIGFLGADAAAFAPWTAAFVARLTELGWIDGRTINVEYRWSGGRTER